MPPASSSPSDADRPLRVLLAEDDPSTRELLTVGLTLEGFTVDQACDGVEAIVAFDEDRHDAVVTDLMMPRGSGMTVLRSIRKRSDVPILILSDYHDSAHRVIALEEGADDFIGKPLEPRELALRIANLVRSRAAHRTDPTLTVGCLQLNSTERTAEIAGRTLELTGREFDLLAVLAASPRKVFSRTELLSLVWSSNPDWQSVDTVTEHIYRLRQKLNPTASGPQLIQTVRGAGYRLAV